MGLGLINSLADLRAVVRRSFELQRFEPKQPERWRGKNLVAAEALDEAKSLVYGIASCGKLPAWRYEDRRS